MKAMHTSLLAVAIALTFAARAETDWPQLRLTPVASGAFLPVQMVQPQDGSGRFFVVEQPGTIKVYQPISSTPEVSLDISDRAGFFFGGEEGLLSMAFPPGFATKKYFYVFYTDYVTPREILSRFYVSEADANLADPNSEQILLELPRSATTVNSGQLLFGRDGYLYVGVGDHGFDPGVVNRAQDTKSLFGKILRLDVESSSDGYRIPPMNPFAQDPRYAPEIWALGVRNPYRFSFDRATGELYMGDVGQLTWEELNVQPVGAGGLNYGWPLREGKHVYIAGATSRLTDPFFEIQHVAGPAAIIGGFVYRGPDAPRMNGLYFFSDFYSGVISAAKRTPSRWEVETVAKTGHFISSFSEDTDGRLYITDYLSGDLFRIDDSGQAAPPRFTPADGVISTNVVTISSLTPGATVRHTIDGTDPDEHDSSALTVAITNGTTLKARAFRGDLTPSEITTATFTLKVAAPRFLPSQGPVAPGTSIAIQSGTPGALIHYTTDGTDPDVGSPQYTGPVPYNSGMTLKARGFKSGFVDSDVAAFSASPLEFDSIEIVGYYGDTALRWPSENGKQYQLQFNDDLTTWFNLALPIQGTGSQLSYTNTQVFPLRTGRHFRLQSFQP